MQWRTGWSQPVKANRCVEIGHALLGQSYRSALRRRAWVSDSRASDRRLTTRVLRPIRVGVTRNREWGNSHDLSGRGVADNWIASCVPRRNPAPWRALEQGQPANLDGLTS